MYGRRQVDGENHKISIAMGFHKIANKSKYLNNRKGRVRCLVLLSSWKVPRVCRRNLCSGYTTPSSVELGTTALAPWESIPLHLAVRELEYCVDSSFLRVQQYGWAGGLTRFPLHKYVIPCISAEFIQNAKIHGEKVDRMQQRNDKYNRIVHEINTNMYPVYSQVAKKTERCIKGLSMQRA